MSCVCSQSTTHCRPLRSLSGEALMNLGLPIRLGEKDYDSAVFEFFAE